MKKFFCLFLIMIPLMVLNSCNPVAAQTEVKTGTAFRLTGSTFPAKYLGVKITKGTCSGKLKVQYSMKRPD